MSRDKQEDVPSCSASEDDSLGCNKFPESAHDSHPHRCDVVESVVRLCKQVKAQSFTVRQEYHDGPGSAKTLPIGLNID
jgi:hypothetical protein